jgi:transcriptional repressor NrdR
MVCIYCGSPTGVNNSRLQRRTNSVWRRRVCQECGAVFTTEENAKLHAGIMVSGSTGKLAPLSRDRLFVSIHDSCKHRHSALDDASALTQTILARLLAHHRGGVVTRDDIVRAATSVLRRFDMAAATFYAAYHPLAAETAETTTS